MLEKIRLVKKKVIGAIKRLRFQWKRIVSVMLLFSLVFSFIGIKVSQEKEVKAFGGVAEYAYGAIFNMATVLASFAGGGSTDEVLTSREKAGITDINSATNYVKESTVNNSNFTKMFKFQSIQQQAEFTECLAKFWLTCSYV